MRGDLVLVAMQGDLGKPRPAVIIQSNALENLLDSVIICPLTSSPSDASYFRVPITPTPENGLQTVSFIMADKTSAIRRTRLGPRIGQLTVSESAQLNAALAFTIGLADVVQR